MNIPSVNAFLSTLFNPFVQRFSGLGKQMARSGRDRFWSLSYFSSQKIKMTRTKAGNAERRSHTATVIFTEKGKGQRNGRAAC